MALRNLAGLTFGRWTVERLDESSGKVKYWFCRCECGTERRVIAWGLTSGGSVSCGCFNREQSSKKHKTHGMKKHPAYNSWRNMRHRCELSTDVSYATYGGVGVKVCERWHSFEAFWEDVGPTWADGMTIDRIDPTGHYEPGNVRWATPKQQANNRTNHRMIHTSRGWMNVSQAAEVFNINRSTIMRRLNDGWQKAHVFDPVRFSPRWHKEE